MKLVNGVKQVWIRFLQDVYTQVHSMSTPRYTRCLHLGTHDDYTQVHQMSTPRYTRCLHLGTQDDYTQVHQMSTPRYSRYLHQGTQDEYTQVHKMSTYTQVHNCDNIIFTIPNALIRRLSFGCFVNVIPFKLLEANQVESEIII